MMNFQGKAALITGGTKGLGRALAAELAAEGARVVVTGRNVDGFPAQAFGIIKAIKSDISCEEEVQSAAAESEALLGGIDLWVNNAGVWLPPTPLEELPMDRIREMVQINLLGLIYATREAIVRMKSRKSGTIVNIISTSALEGRAGQAPYCATKFGAAGFSKAIREEVRSAGIEVFNVYPGGMQTNLFDEAKPSVYGSYMDPAFVARQILENLRRSEPEQELVLKRPSAG